MQTNNSAQTESHREVLPLSPANPAYGTALSEAIGRQNEAYRRQEGSTVAAGFRRILRRLDNWTLTVFNPRYPTGHRG